MSQLSGSRLLTRRPQGKVSTFVDNAGEDTKCHNNAVEESAPAVATGTEVPPRKLLVEKSPCLLRIMPNNTRSISPAERLEAW